ncbi:MAG: redoxin family protein, partial [Gammaproteobacteria bacterium]|nr:redoxin family protein [Gammaproteobacteria bacterium]
PWALDAWAKSIDPERSIRFLSDGNLELVRAMGLIARESEHFMGERSRRFVMIVQDAVVEKLAVETNILDVTCTRESDILVAA